MAEREVIREFKGPHAFLSNFHRTVVFWDGVPYPTNEHAFQAAKTFDKEERQQIETARTPGDAKRYGRNCTLRHDWNEVRVAVMLHLCRQKFSPFMNPQLALSLLVTGFDILQEGNTWNDKFWGVDLRTGQGSNHLGTILMEVRSEIRPQWDLMHGLLHSTEISPPNRRRGTVAG